MPAKKDPRTGRWFYRKLVRLPDGSKHRLFGTPAKFNLPDTKLGAQEAERLAIAQIHETGSIEPAAPAPPPEPAKKVPTLDEFAREQWLPLAKVDGKPATQRMKASALRRLRRVATAIVDTPIDQIDRRAVDQVRQALVEQGFKPGSINTTLRAFRHLLGLAHGYGLLPQIPKVALVKEGPEKIDFLTTEELQRMLDAPVPPLVKLMVLVAAQTGLRLGELRALEWGDVDLAGRRLFVRRNFTDGHLGTPKSGKTREVPLPKAALASLNAWRAEATHRLVFPGPRGGYLDEGLAYRWLDATTDGGGVRHIGWHMLRHTYASHLVQRGVSLRVIQKLLGHSSITQTEIYAHLAPSNLHDAVTALDAPDPAPAPR